MLELVVFHRMLQTFFPAWILPTTKEKNVLKLNNARLEHSITLSSGMSHCIVITSVHLSRTWHGEQTLFAIV